jgi:hypothetical protein
MDSLVAGPEDRNVTPLQGHGSSGKAASPATGKRRFVYFVLWLSSGESKGWFISLFLVSFGLYELAKQELSIRQWGQTQGTVVESQTVWLERTRDVSGPPLAVAIRYQYAVGGEKYESTCITTGEPVLFYDLRQAAEFRKQYPGGAKVTVFYAPYAPSEATLIAGRSSGPWILLGFGVPCLLVVVYMRRKRRRLGEEPHPHVDIPVHLP